MRVSRAILGTLAISILTSAALPVKADTVVEKTCYKTSYVPVRKKTTVYRTAYVPVTQKRVVYEKRMVPVSKKMTVYRTAYVPIRSKSTVRTAYAQPDTVVERKVVTRTAKLTVFIPTAYLTQPTTVVTRTTELMPSSVVLPPPVVTTTPIITTAPEFITPEPGTVILKEKHHKVRVSTLEPVAWY